MKYNLIKSHTNKSYATNDIAYIVTHVDLGTAKSTKNCIEGVQSKSYHEYVNKDDDTIRQYVPLDKGAWHSGNINKPTNRGARIIGNTSPNRSSYALCFEAAPVDAMGNVTFNWDIVKDGKMPTDDQIKRGAQRIIDLGLDHLPIIAHVEITSWKPKVVLEVNKKLNQYISELRQEEDAPKTCVQNSTTMELINELISRF